MLYKPKAISHFMQNPKQRFTNRVSDYIKARPGYPGQIIQLLTERFGLRPDAQVGDIGSGTGLLAEIFLKNGNPVYGVEPNQAMRMAGESHLRDYHRVTSINGCAEATSLPEHSCDFLVAGQSFHWFEQNLTRQEFRRILKPLGWIALIWNTLPETESVFCADYANLFRTYCTQYQGGSNHHANIANILPFFGPQPISQFRLPNPGMLNKTDFRSRILSSSQTPEPGHPLYAQMQAAITTLVNKHQQQGHITLPYETAIFVGQLPNEYADHA